MSDIVFNFLEYIRPSFWQGDYNFLWIYLLVFVILIKFFQSLSSKYTAVWTHRTARVEKHKISMQEVWGKRQKDLESAAPYQLASNLSENNIKNQKSDDKVEEEEEEKKTEKKPAKKIEKVEEEEESEEIKRLKKKQQYFQGEGSGGNGYRPSLRDRYPNVYKRTGG